MARARISTTVDAVQLEKARALAGLRDSELFDRALDLFVRQRTIDQEIEALDRFPYEADAELAMGDAPDGLDSEFPYDGEVPDDVLRLAAERRAERARRAS